MLSAGPFYAFFAFLPFFRFTLAVQMACFGPSLNNTFALKDAPGRTRNVSNSECLKALCVGIGVGVEATSTTK